MARTALLSLFLALSVAFACSERAPSTHLERCQRLMLRAELRVSGDATLVVIVTLVRGPGEDVAAVQERLLRELDGMDHEVLRRYGNFPILTLRVGADALCHLLASPLVESVQEDADDPPTSD